MLDLTAWKWRTYLEKVPLKCTGNSTTENISSARLIISTFSLYLFLSKIQSCVSLYISTVPCSSSRPSYFLGFPILLFSSLSHLILCLIIFSHIKKISGSLTPPASWYCLPSLTACFLFSYSLYFLLLSVFILLLSISTNCLSSLTACFLLLPIFSCCLSPLTTWHY